MSHSALFGLRLKQQMSTLFTIIIL